MKKMKKILLTTGMLLAVSSLFTGCKKGTDFLYYIYGSDQSIKKEEAQITYDGSNGVSLIYDANIWEEPYMVQDDTISIVAGTSFNYTAVLLQTTDAYTDFLLQSGEELLESTTALKYEYELEVPNAVKTESVRYDCGTYQAIFSEITFEEQTVYLSAATHSGSTEQIEELLRSLYVPSTSH